MRYILRPEVGQLGNIKAWKLRQEANRLKFILLDGTMPTSDGCTHGKEMAANELPTWKSKGVALRNNS